MSQGTTSTPDPWHGIDLALDLMTNWLEANEADYDDDEQTPFGPTLSELRDLTDAALGLAARRGA